MRRELRDRAWWLTAVPGLVGAALLMLAAVAPFLQALVALTIIVLPSYLIAWPVLQPRLGSAAAFTITGGLSIGMVALAGIALNLLPWGLQTATWLAYVIVVLALALAFGRRPKAWRPDLTMVPHEAVMAGIGATLMVTALLFARFFAGNPTESFTQLWIAPTAEAPSSSIDLRIRSEEQTATGYRLEVWHDGSPIKSWAEIQLAPRQEWSETLTVGTGRIEARLYRLNAPGTMYRHVTLQVVPGARAALGGGA